MSCDTITLKTHFINAVKAAINEGEPAMDNVTIGMDLGDKNNAVEVLDKKGRKELSGTIDNNADAIRAFFFAISWSNISY